MPQLSQREYEIRDGRAIQARQMRDAGWSLRAIAKRLRVSEWTVRQDLKPVASARFGVHAPRKPRTSHASNQPESGNVITFRRSR